MSMQKLETAKSYLYNANRYLETGEAINWIVDELRAGIMWTLEAWLWAKGIEPKFGHGYHSVKVQFSENAPKPITSEVNHCLSKLVSLDDFPPIDIEGEEELFNMPEYASTEWKASMKDCLSQAKNIIKLIEKDTCQDAEKRHKKRRRRCEIP